MTNDTQHENHDHSWLAAGVTPSDRAYRRGDHLVRQHGIDRWQEMPAGMQAQDRLHTQLHHDDLDADDRTEGLEEALYEDEHGPLSASVDSVLVNELDLLGLVQSVGSQMEAGDPERHIDQAVALVILLWSRIIDTDTPAQLLGATRTASRLLGDSLERLGAVDPQTALRASREAVAAATRLLEAATRLLEAAIGAAENSTDD